MGGERRRAAAARLRLATLGLACLGLAGCAEVTLLSHAAKTVYQDRKPTSTYKVGKPYQIKGRWYYPREEESYRKVGVASWYGPGFHGRQTANGEIYDQYALTAAHTTLPLPTDVRVTNLENGRSLVLRVNDRGPFVDDRLIDVSQRAAELLGFRRKGIAKVEVVALPRSNSPVDVQVARSGTAPVVAPAAAAVPNDGKVHRPAGQSATFGVQSELPATPKPQPQPRPEAVAVAKPAAKAAPATVVAAATPAVAVVPQGPLYVQVGAFSRLDNALRLQARLSSLSASEVHQIMVEGRSLFRLRLGPLQEVAEAETLVSQLNAQGLTGAHLISH